MDGHIFFKSSSVAIKVKFLNKTREFVSQLNGMYVTYFSIYFQKAQQLNQLKSQKYAFNAMLFTAFIGMGISIYSTEKLMAMKAIEKIKKLE